MHDEIAVLDDFLPAEIYGKLVRFVGNEAMSYGMRSNARTDPHGHWSRRFVTAGRSNLADVSYLMDGVEEFAPILAAWDFIKLAHLSDGVLLRCYLNGYTYGTDGYFHSDSERPDEHTAILFMNQHWDPDWGGETAFLDERGDIIRSVLPRRNRAVIFPARLLHAGRGVSRKCMELRQTLVFKTRKRGSNNFEKLSVFLRQKGATTLAHREGSLHDHLLRTFSLLESRGFDDDVCFGGGLHAIYGTNIFKQNLMIPPSSAIVKQFGEGAERLAHLFSVIDRPRTLEAPRQLDSDTALVEGRDGQMLSLARKTFDDLRKIECANLYDQAALARWPNLSALWGEHAARHSIGADAI
jgi:SM-20-related protein